MHPPTISTEPGSADQRQMSLHLRPYRDDNDLQAMQNILMAGRAAAGPMYYVHVGDLNWWLFYLDQDFQQRIVLWEQQADGRVLGWILLSPRFRAFDVFLHPDDALPEPRNDLFDWAESQLSKLVCEQAGKDVSTMWVSEYDHLLMAHLEERGFAQNDDYVIVMQQSLAEAIPQALLPPGYCLRHVAGEHEVAERAQVAHAAFGSGKPIAPYTEGYLRFMRSPVYTPELDLVVAAPNGQFAAFCLVWLDMVNQAGYFEPVGTHPYFQRRGLGKAVLHEGLRRMQAHGMKTASVCVESDNLAARKLYEAVGFQKTIKIHTYTKKL